MIVIDANVAVKWFLPEPLSDVAEALLDEHDVRIAPEHILVEVGHVLVMASRAGKISLEDVHEAITTLSELVQLQPTHALIGSAIDIADEIGCTVYDALYVAAAETHEAVLVTADLKLGRQLSAAHRLGCARLLGV